MPKRTRLATAAALALAVLATGSGAMSAGGGPAGRVTGVAVDPSDPSAVRRDLARARAHSRGDGVVKFRVDSPPQRGGVYFHGIVNRFVAGPHRGRW